MQTTPDLRLISNVHYIAAPTLLSGALAFPVPMAPILQQHHQIAYQNKSSSLCTRSLEVFYEENLDGYRKHRLTSDNLQYMQSSVENSRCCNKAMDCFT